MAYSLTSHVSQLRYWAAALAASASRLGCAPYTILYTVKEPNSLLASSTALSCSAVLSPKRLTQCLRVLVYERTAKQQLYVINSHLREKERKQAGRVRRKYNIRRLPAAAQWSGIKKTCYLNCEHFLSFARRQGIVQQAVSLLSLSSSNQSCTLSFLNRCSLLRCRHTHTHTHRTTKVPLIIAQNTFLTLSSPALIFLNLILLFSTFEINF